MWIYARLQELNARGSYFKKPCVSFVAAQLIFAGLERAFNPLTGFGRQCLLRLPAMIAVLRGSPQKFDLFPITRTPDAKRQMNPQPNSREQRLRVVERRGLQSDGLFAIG